MEVICAILVALFGIGFGIFMALQPEDAIALSSRRRYTQVPEPTEEYIRLTRLEGIVVSVLSAVLLVVLLFAPRKTFLFPLADFFSPCYNEKKRRRFFVMVKHVILWQLKDELSAEEKAAVKAGIKEGLESLSGKIPGLVDIHVNIDALPSSNADLMLDTTFESAEALKGYSTHPAHVAVANSKVRPYYKNRVCLDYEV